MEPTAAACGGPFEFQLAATNWTGAEEAPDACGAQVWAAPAGGLPLEYASIVDIFGSSSCGLQPYMPESSLCQHQLVEYNYYNNYYAAAAQHHDPTDGNGTTTTQAEDHPSSSDEEKLVEELVKRENKFTADGDGEFLKRKMHRYPPSIRALDKDDLYTVPRVVAIGPYHHYAGDHLNQAEEVKHVAAYHCMKESGLKARELYGVVISVVKEIDARGLYDDKDGMAGICYNEDFLPMMFYDACFLVMYMLWLSGQNYFDPVLYDFFESNENDIAHDIMLLENQIPWKVVDAVMNKCTSYEDPVERKKKFIARWKTGCLQDLYKDNDTLPRQVLKWDEDYDEAPHLLGLLRSHMVERSSKPPSDMNKIESLSISAGAIELAEMGIFLTADETTGLPANMRLSRKWIIFAELPMAPLSLNVERASMLVNMAALERCTTPDFFNVGKREDSAVCSYLRLLCMLMHREEDVHELRTNGILKGAGLTNKQALDFFTSLQSLRYGRCYAEVMLGIELYRLTRWWGWLKLWAFIYNNWKYIATTASAFAGFIGFMVTLKGAFH